MKTLDKILIGLVVLCLAAILFLINFNKSKLISLKKVQEENQTLREALSKPKIVEKPVIRYIKVTEIKVTTETVKVIEKVTETIEIIGEKTSEPVLPEKKETVQPEKKFGVGITAGTQTNSGIVIGVSVRWKKLKVILASNEGNYTLLLNYEIIRF